MTYLTAEKLQRINSYYHCNRYILSLEVLIHSIYKKTNRLFFFDFINFTLNYLKEIIRDIEKQNNNILAQLYGIQHIILLVSKKTECLDDLSGYIEFWTNNLKPKIIKYPLFTENQFIDQNVYEKTETSVKSLFEKLEICIYHSIPKKSIYNDIENNIQLIMIYYDYIIWIIKSRYGTELFNEKRFKTNSKLFIDHIWQNYCFSKLTKNFYLNINHYFKYLSKMNLLQFNKRQDLKYLRHSLNNYKLGFLYNNRNDVIKKYTFLYLVLKYKQIPKDIILEILNFIIF